MAVTPGPHVPGTQEALHDCLSSMWMVSTVFCGSMLGVLFNLDVGVRKHH